MVVFTRTALILALAGIAGTAAAQAELYGQVNKGFFTFDDGVTTDSVVVDNDLASSRLGLKGEQGLTNGLSASYLLEAEVTSNNSNSATSGFAQNAAAGQSRTPLSSATGGGASFNERQARVGLAGGWGAVFLGQQSTAIDGTRTRDLGGVQDVMTADYAKLSGGATFRTGAGALSGVNILSTRVPSASNRAPALRYDSPVLLGLQGRTAIIQGGDADASLWYDGSLAGLKASAAVGVLLNNDTATTTPNRMRTRADASFSLKHTSGPQSWVAGTVAYSRQTLANRQPNAQTPSGWYGKLSYGWSDYELAADYGQSTHYGSVGVAGAAPGTDRLQSWGLGGQYNMGQGVSLAALYRTYGLTRSAASFRDLDLYGLNLRVKF